MRIATFSLTSFTLFLLVIISTSCNRYIDKVATEKRIPIYKGHLTYYPDSNIVVFNSNIGIKAHNESYSPRTFYTKLPKGLVSYQFSNAVTFAFYYKKGQTIAIVIDLSDSTSKKDSIYEPSKSEIENYIRHFTISYKERFNMWNIEYKQDRKQLIIKKSGATILLYNIMPGNYDLFINDLNRFKFL